MIERRIVKGIRPDRRTPRQIAREVHALVDGGARLLPAGEAREDPQCLLSGPYAPKYAVSLFDATYYLTDYRFDDDLNFMVAYVALREDSGRVRALYPRIVYKDSSLTWRVATHYVRTDDDNWIGKGEVRWVQRPDGEFLESAEETTNLPYEIQAALDTVSRMRRSRRDERAIPLILRHAPAQRIEPYADFTRPRLAARTAHPVNRNRPVARFTRRCDPTSLEFTTGYEPDFTRGVLEMSRSASRVYNGPLRKYRILSTNREIQYLFIASPTHVWINPPQTLTTELTTYGVRTLDVLAAEDVFVPGYEYHFIDDTIDPPELHSQIPAGFAGEPNAVEPARADASPWIESLPVVREFRRKVLRQQRRR